MQLSQKERSLLEDQKSHEELCIKKYINYSNQTQDTELKQMFQTHAQHEQMHLNSINQLLQGQIPNMSQGQQSQQQQQTQAPAGQAGMTNQQDADLCQDMLETEKYVSHTYDTTIFEFRDTNARDVLNHIQKEEQQHGLDIFNYMSSHGMYKVH